MEQFDIEQTPRTNGQAAATGLRNFVRGASGDRGNRMISLRKYSTAICLTEALAIVLLVYLLLKIPPQQDALPGHYQADSALQSTGNPDDPYRTYTSSSGPLWRRSRNNITLQVGLKSACNQRRHDRQFSVICKSDSIRECRPVQVEEHSNNSLQGDNCEKAPSNCANVEIIKTTKSGHRLKHSREKLDIVQMSVVSSHKTIVRVKEKQLRQRIIGWGGALTDSSINNILSLTTNGTRQLLQDYFGPNGLMFNLVRVTIGGSDFSARFYTNADKEPDEQELLKEVDLVAEDLLYKIPTLKLIRQMNEDFKPKFENDRELKIFGSMWSPPVWMKTNRHFNKGQLRGSVQSEDASLSLQREEKYYFMLAKLKVEFLKNYLKQGVKFWGLTVMNEPFFSVQPFLNFNTMIFPPADYGNYIARFLGPMLKANKQLGPLKLMIHDDNRRFIRNYTGPLLRKANIRKFIDGVSVHGYADEDYYLMANIYKEHKGDALQPNNKSESNPLTVDDSWFVLPTELCSGHLPFMEKALVGNWHRGMHYALDIIRSLQNSAAGWVDWNMALDIEGGPGWLGGRLDAAVIVDKSRDLYHKSPMFYVLGQFSRYIPPGSTLIEMEVQNEHYDNHLEIVSFMLPNERSYATVIVNNNPYPVEVLLWLDDKTRRAPTGMIEMARVEAPADSVMTVRYERGFITGGQPRSGVV